VLVVVFAVGLFCGSIYLLLGTNLGARLGFLVSFTGLMGFLMLLSMLWVTTQSPLNTLKGRVGQWEVEEVVARLPEAESDKVREIQESGEKVSSTEAANVKAFVDAALVRPAEGAEPAEGAPAPSGEFAMFEEVTDYLIGDTFEVGGSEPNPLDFELTHTPKFAAVEFCEVRQVEVDFGLPPATPECDFTSSNRGFVILSLDLGSLRVPPIVAMVTFTVLFGLGLLGLHWREKDAAAAKAAAKAGADS